MCVYVWCCNECAEMSVLGLAGSVALNVRYTPLATGAFDCDYFDIVTPGEKRFRGGLVFEAHRLLYHSTLGSRVIQKKKQKKKLSVLTL